ncbi:hypothetical protein HAP48_0035160 [Bradyrhizobium septentrionale]|uniref:Uncharacterized protein n=1 Tax=Bradyrhizobium septentrionale TaxID=1404411 RepID=A0A974A070_9BRAD|nr:hypothetical protein [Bradyrhizobium septentrionale]UGY13774.1 hypothetical protein HAP48_0035160 [Bradyrhizobium septentrionale]
MTDDNITPLPVRFKQPPSDDEPMLKVVSWGAGCNHRYDVRDGRTVHASYQIREGETEVECSLCKTRLDPMFVLRALASEETQWLRARQRYIDEMRRLRERSRTKCFNCGKMTEISRR